MEDVICAPASASDRRAIKALLARCDLLAEDLRAHHLDHFLLCRLRDSIVGSIGLEPLGEVALLRSFAVEPALRGQGIGHQLWDRARDRAHAGGIGHLYLLTTTAEQLFTRWGFRRVARDQVPDAVRNTSEFMEMCPSTAVVMTRGPLPRPDVGTRASGGTDLLSHAPDDHLKP